MTHETALSKLNWVYHHRVAVGFVMLCCHVVAFGSLAHMSTMAFGYYPLIEFGYFLLGFLAFWWSTEWWYSIARAAHFMVEHPEITTPSKVDK